MKYYRASNLCIAFYQLRPEQRSTKKTKDAKTLGETKRKIRVQKWYCHLLLSVVLHVYHKVIIRGPSSLEYSLVDATPV